MKDLIFISHSANMSMPNINSTIYSCQTKLIFIIAQILENSASKLKFDSSTIRSIDALGQRRVLKARAKAVECRNMILRRLI